MPIFTFLRRNLKGCQEKIKQTADFSLIRSFMEYGAPVWDPYQNYNSDRFERVQRRAARFVKSIQNTLVFLICLMCWGGRLFLKGVRRLDLFCFTKLLTVWHKCPSKASLLRRIIIRVLENKMKFRQIGHTTSQYGQSFFSLKLLVHGTGKLSLKVRHWLYLSQIYNTLKGSSGIMKQNMNGTIWFQQLACYLLL